MKASKQHENAKKADEHLFDPEGTLVLGNILPFQTPFDLDQRKPEKYTKPSKTVPGQTLSIPEILIRHAQGQPINQGSTQNMVFSGEHYIPNMQSLDIIDQQEQLRIHRERTERLTKSYNEKMQAREQAKAKKQEEEQWFQDFVKGVRNEEKADLYTYFDKRNKEKEEAQQQLRQKIERDKPSPE